MDAHFEQEPKESTPFGFVPGWGDHPNTGTLESNCPNLWFPNVCEYWYHLGNRSHAKTQDRGYSCTWAAVVFLLALQMGVMHLNSEPPPQSGRMPICLNSALMDLPSLEHAHDLPAFSALLRTLKGLPTLLTLLPKHTKKSVWTSDSFTRKDFHCFPRCEWPTLFLGPECPFDLCFPSTFSHCRWGLANNSWWFWGDFDALLKTFLSLL